MNEEDLEALKGILEGLSETESARLVHAVVKVTTAAQKKFGVAPHPAEVAALAYVKSATLGPQDLLTDGFTMNSALWELEQNAASIKQHIKKEEGAQDSVDQRANDDFEKMERIQLIENPALRMSEMRKLKTTKQPREILTPTDEEIEKLSPQERISYARGQDVSDRIAILRSGE